MCNAFIQQESDKVVAAGDSDVIVWVAAAPC